MNRTSVLALLALSLLPMTGCQTSQNDSASLSAVSLAALAQEEQVAPPPTTHIVLLTWDANLDTYVHDQNLPLRLKKDDRVILRLDSAGAPRNVADDASITHVHFYHAPRVGPKKKTPNRHLGSWHRLMDTANPRSTTHLGAYTVELNEDNGQVVDHEIVITNIEHLSSPHEHRYVYGVEIVENSRTHNVDPELINEGGKGGG